MGQEDLIEDLIKVTFFGSVTLFPSHVNRMPKMPLNRLVLLAPLISLVLCAGIAQAQVNQSGTDSPTIAPMTDSSKYLQPYQRCLDADQARMEESLQGERLQFSKPVKVSTKNKPNSEDKTKKAAGVENAGPQSDLLKPSFEKNRGSITQDMGPQVSGVGMLPTNQASLHSAGLSSSFLDGYLLKSLQDKGIGRKREPKGQEPTEDLTRKKVKRTY